MRSACLCFFAAAVQPAAALRRWTLTAFPEGKSSKGLCSCSFCTIINAADFPFFHPFTLCSYREQRKSLFSETACSGTPLWECPHRRSSACTTAGRQNKKDKRFCTGSYGAARKKSSLIPATSGLPLCQKRLLFNADAVFQNSFASCLKKRKLSSIQRCS